MENIQGLFEQLLSKDNVAACGASDALRRLSADSDAVYPYFTQIARLLDHKNSLMRNRALTLLAANAQWDDEDLFSGVIEAYLTHITDAKPITARQCIQSLPAVAPYKPHLVDRIRSALASADVSMYAGSMRPLVERDIRNALRQIDAQRIAP